MRIIKIVGYFIFFLVVWYMIVWVFRIPSYIFPSPEDVLKELTSDGNLYFSSSITTLLSAVIGFLIANFISVTIALMISFERKLEHFILPVAIILKTLPVIAIAPVLMIWFSSGAMSRIIAAAVVCFFPSLVNMLRGVKSIDSDFVDLFKVYSASKIQLLRYLIIPSTLPYLFSSLKVSSSLAITGALVGEFIGAKDGLGFLIIVNYYNSNIPAVFAAIFISSFMGVAFYYFINYLETKLIYWTPQIDLS